MVLLWIEYLSGSAGSGHHLREISSLQSLHGKLFDDELTKLGRTSQTFNELSMIGGLARVTIEAKNRFQ